MITASQIGKTCIFLSSSQSHSRVLAMTQRDSATIAKIFNKYGKNIHVNITFFLFCMNFHEEIFQYQDDFSKKIISNKCKYSKFPIEYKTIQISDNDLSYSFL